MHLLEMSDTKINESVWPTLHNMTEHHSKLYDVFVASRAELRAAQREEDITRRNEFYEEAKKAGENTMNIEIVHEKSESKQD